MLCDGDLVSLLRNVFPHEAGLGPFCLLGRLILMAFQYHVSESTSVFCIVYDQSALSVG